MTTSTLFMFLVSMLAAVLALVAVPLSHREHWEVLRNAYRVRWLRSLMLDVMFSELGASVVTYAYPVSGTTAPTTTQMANQSTLTCTVNFADADTTATITHNFQASAAALLRLEPLIFLYQNTLGTPSPLIAVTLATNTIVLTKQSTAAGSGGTLTAIVMRPHSILMPNF